MATKCGVCDQIDSDRLVTLLARPGEVYSIYNFRYHEKCLKHRFTKKDMKRAEIGEFTPEQRKWSAEDLGRKHPERVEYVSTVSVVA